MSSEALVYAVGLGIVFGICAVTAGVFFFMRLSASGPRPKGDGDAEARVAMAPVAPPPPIVAPPPAAYDASSHQAPAQASYQI